MFFYCIKQYFPIHNNDIIGNIWKVVELDEQINNLTTTINEITNNYNDINNKINQLQQKKKQVAQIKINKTYSKDQIIESIKNIYVDGNKLEIHIDINGVLFEDTLYI